MTDQADYLIVGAGPAGLAAAITASELGLSVTLIDEQSAPGGQIHRNIENRTQYNHNCWPEMDEEGLKLIQAFRKSKCHYLPNTQVWQLEKNGKVYVTDGTKARCIKAKKVLIAVGAMERPLPFEGWTLPGVMTVGSAQIRYKTTNWVPQGRSTWIAGSGPLIWLYALQAIESGAEISGILDTTPKSNIWPSLAYLPKILKNPSPITLGLQWQKRVRAAGLKVIANISNLKALGMDQLKAIAYRQQGKWKQLPAKLLLVHHGVVPNIQATLSLKINHRWDETLRCYAPIVDLWGNTSEPLYAAAGDGAGIVGAQASRLQGNLAALHFAFHLGFINQEQLDQKSTLFKKALKNNLLPREFINQWFAVRKSLLQPDNAVIVCRCESISAAEIRQAVKLGAQGPNQMKAFTRCGMGPCQGRMCGLAASEIISQTIGTPAQNIGLYNIRPPLKPISLREFASLSE